MKPTEALFCVIVFNLMLLRVSVSLAVSGRPDLGLGHHSIMRGYSYTWLGPSYSQSMAVLLCGEVPGAVARRVTVTGAGRLVSFFNLPQQGLDSR